MAMSRTTSSSLELRLSYCLRKVNLSVGIVKLLELKFSDKYIVPEKLVAGYAEHLAQIKMRKEKKKEKTERERDIDWVGLYNSDKLSSSRVDGLSSHFSHHKFTFKGKKAEKVSMIKAHIGMLLYDSMECQQPRQAPLRNVL